MPLGGLESPPALAGLEVSLLEESYASTLRPNLPLGFKFLEKLIDETERDGKDTREIEEDEVEVEEEETKLGVKKGFTVNEYMIK